MSDKMASVVGGMFSDGLSSLIRALTPWCVGSARSLRFMGQRDVMERVTYMVKCSPHEDHSPVPMSKMRKSAHSSREKVVVHGELNGSSLLPLLSIKMCCALGLA